MNSECGEMSRFSWCGWRKSISGKVVTLLENLGQLFFFLSVIFVVPGSRDTLSRAAFHSLSEFFLIAVKICVVSVLRVI